MSSLAATIGEAPLSTAERPATPRVTSERIRVGVIGIGFGQAVHVPAFRSVPGCEVVGIAASERDRASRVALRLGVPRSFGGWREAVGCKELDVVTIAVPPDIQPEIVEAAASEGRHVFCEKPLAATPDQARRAVAAVESAGVRHGFDLEFPELPSWQALHRAIHAGDLGAVREVRIDWRVPHRPRPSDRSAWKDEAARGGSVLGGFLAHALYHAEWLGGRFTSLHARAQRGAARNMRAAIEGELAGGARVRISVDSASTGSMEHRLAVVGDAGEAVLSNVGGQHGGPFDLVVTGRSSLRVQEPELDGGDSRLRAVAVLAHRFATAIRDGGQMWPDLNDGLRVQELLDAVMVSADAEQSVAL